MLLKYLKPILFFIPLMTIQLIVIPLIAIQHVAPNLILILLVFYTLKQGQMYGTILGFVLGFLFDIISGGMVGACMFSFTITGFIAGYFFNINKVEINIASFMFVFIVFLCGTLSAFLYSSVANTNPDVSFLYLIIEEGALPGLYTAAISIPIFILNPQEGIE